MISFDFQQSLRSRQTRKMQNYICSECKKSDIKLWRGYSEELAILRCVDCTCKHEKVKSINENDLKKTDAIKWSVPAVPSRPNSYWGYTSVPENMVQWWNALPLRA